MSTRFASIFQMPCSFHTRGKESHDEYQLLDKAGRIKLSEDMLTAAGIDTNRVKVSVVDKNIVISLDK